MPLSDEDKAEVHWKDVEQPPGTLTVYQIAPLAGLSVGHVWRLVKSGEFEEAGNLVPGNSRSARLFTQASVEAYLGDSVHSWSTVILRDLRLQLPRVLEFSYVGHEGTYALQAPEMAGLLDWIFGVDPLDARCQYDSPVGLEAVIKKTRRMEGASPITVITGLYINAESVVLFSPPMMGEES